MQVEPRISRSEKLRGMTKEGIPHSLRPHMWMRISGAYEKKIKSDLSYKDVVKASSNDHLMTSKQIEKVKLIKKHIGIDSCVYGLGMYMHMKKQTHIHTHTHTHTHTLTFTWIYTHAHTCMHICTYACARAHTHTHTCWYIHTRTHAHTHTHTHTNRNGKQKEIKGGFGMKVKD